MCDPLEGFLSNEILEARESYSAYQKSEQQYESSVLRYSRTSKEKAEEMEEELALAQKAHHLATSNASVSANLVLDKTGVVLAESVLMMAVMSSAIRISHITQIGTPVEGVGATLSPMYCALTR